MKLVLLTLLLVCVYQCSAVTCRKGFIDISGGCYHFSEEKSSFYDAIRLCKSKNASLVSFETIQENFAIKLHLYYKQEKEITYWTSGTDAFHKGQHKWMATLGDMVYTDWCNSFRNKDTCVYILHTPNKATCWVDGNCFDGKNYICEYSPETVCDCSVCSKNC